MDLAGWGRGLGGREPEAGDSGVAVRVLKARDEGVRETHGGIDSRTGWLIDRYPRRLRGEDPRMMSRLLSAELMVGLPDSGTQADLGNNAAMHRGTCSALGNQNKSPGGEGLAYVAWAQLRGIAVDWAWQ